MSITQKKSNITMNITQKKQHIEDKLNRLRKSLTKKITKDFDLLVNYTISYIDKKIDACIEQLISVFAKEEEGINSQSKYRQQIKLKSSNNVYNNESYADQSNRQMHKNSSQKYKNNNIRTYSPQIKQNTNQDNNNSKHQHNRKEVKKHNQQQQITNKSNEQKPSTTKSQQQTLKSEQNNKKLQEKAQRSKQHQNIHHNDHDQQQQEYNSDGLQVWGEDCNNSREQNYVQKKKQVQYTRLLEGLSLYDQQDNEFTFGQQNRHSNYYYQTYRLRHNNTIWLFYDK